MATGIRVSALAKELGVDSKAILARLKGEGLGGDDLKHSSTLKLGLAETVRGWFPGGGGDTQVAVETAPPKTKAPPRRRKAGGAEEHAGEDAIQLELPSEDDAAHAAPEPEPARSEIRDEPVVAEAPAPAPASAPAAAEIVAVTAPPPAVVEAPPMAVEAAPAPPPEPPAEVVVHAPAAPVAPVIPAPPAVAAEAEKPLKPAPPAPGQDRQQLRPAVTLSSRGTGPVTVERRAVQPAPKLTTLEPAKIQGPRVVREEKPETVPLPRPRRGPAETGPSTPIARAQAGRGVRSVKEEETDEEQRKKAAEKNKKPGASLSSRRRTDGRRGEAEEKLREFTDADLLERQERLNAAASYRTGFDTHLKKSAERGHYQPAKSASQRGEPVTIEEPITVRTLSAAMGIKVNDIIKRLMKQGVFATVNQAVERKLAETIALEFGLELQIAEQATQEDLLVREMEQREAASTARSPRPPVVTILGHVDHGKTSLLDKIRSANVAAGEAGGITQHTAAWMVRLGEGEAAKRVTFIDTPGHQAFTAMRARGANMTDIVVLVVSAAEGMQPQTIESMNHARAAGVPIVVAMNKIDRDDANAQSVLGQLAGQGLNPAEWGGDTEVVKTSAITGQGVEELVEILDYQAGLLDLKYDPEVPARGTVIEARIDPGLGPVATVLIQNGTLRVGDVVLAGGGYGRVRSMLSDLGQNLQEAGASTPVIISGLNEVPAAGDRMLVAPDMDRARAIAEERAIRSRQTQLAQQTRVTLDNLAETFKAGEIKTINLIIKGDVQGSVETLARTVSEQNTDEVRVRVIHNAVGAISESDIELADASSAVVIGFHVVPDESARQMAEQRRVEIRLYRVIYELLDDLKKAMSGMLAPEIREKLHGHADIRQVFRFQKRSIAGCMVSDGHISRGSRIRLIRDGRVVVEDLTIDSLRRIKEDVREVKAGLECGIKLANYDDFREGDRFEAYVRETIQRTL